MSGKVRGSMPRECFEVNDAANREAPTGDLNATPAAPAIAAPAAKP